MFRKNISFLFCINPSLPILLGILAGIIPFAVNPDIGAVKAMIFPVTIVTVAYFLMDKRNFLKTGIFAVVGFSALLYSRGLPESHYDRILPERNCGAIVEMEVVDTTCSSLEKLDWMTNPYLMKAEVRRFKYSSSDEWKNTEGAVAVILPKDCPRMGYGDRLLAEGAFILPSPPLFKGDFDFRKYLLANKVRRIYEVSSCKVEETPGKYGFYRKILQFRDYLMDKSVEGMGDFENKKIAAAIIFGCRQGMSPEEKRNFIRSGTIHVISISGLHVGIIAIMLFWIFRWLPFRARHLLIPGIMFIYIFTCGMPPPAVRAFLMISVWCIQRAFLYPSSSLNSVFFAAVAILIFNPFAVLDIGFQFSFIVAGFLVLSWTNSEKWVSSVMEKSCWIPLQGGVTWFTVKNRFLVNITRSVMTSLIAWLSGVGLSLAYQGLFVPASILVNFAIIPFVSLFFAAVILKLIFFPVWFLANSAGYVAELSLDIIRKASEVGSDFGNLCLPHPSSAVLIAFYIFLAILVIAEKRALFFSSAAAIISIIGVWFYSSISSPGLIYVIHGGESQEPVVAICPPGNSRVLLVNSGTRSTVKSLMNILTLRGVDFIDTLLICEARKDFCEAASRMILGKDVRSLVISERYRRSWSSKRAVETAFDSNSETILIKEEDGTVFSRSSMIFSRNRTEKENIDYRIKYDIPESSMHISIDCIGPGIKKLEIRSTNSNNMVIERMNTNIPSLMEIKL